jgi:polysaccharide biosynthesis protein PslH
VRVLFLAPYVPFPVLHGGRNRTLGFVKSLTRFAEVRVLAAGDPRADEAAESRERLGALGVPLEVFAPTGPGPAEADAEDVARPPDALSHFRCPQMREALPRILAEFQPDAVQLEELVMAQYADALPAPRLIDRQKIEWAYLDEIARREAEPAAAAHRREAARFLRYEAEAAGAIDRTIVIGGEDKRLLARFHPPEAIDVVPIAVDDAIARSAGRTAAVRHVLLYGSVDYAPNIEANDLYFREVWPLLARARPDLRTLLVGSGTPPSSLPRDDPRVEARGFVPDIATVLQGPGVLVVPLRVGGGARTKILEAMAAGMPVVSTEIGVENLGLEAGRHYLRAETPAAMAEAVVRLAADPGLYETVGRAAAAEIDGRFRLDVLARDLESIYRRVVPGSAPRRGVPAARTKRALLVGVRPLPDEPEAVGLSFPGHRTAQLGAALEEAGCAVTRVLLDEDEASPTPPAGRHERTHVLAPEAFRGGRELQRIHDDLRPDVVVSAGGYHPARVVARLASDRPRYVDLAGDLAAEAQVRAAHAGDGVVADYLSVLREALVAGDRFAVVGPSQRLVVLGQLGLAGRLSGTRVGEEPVDVVLLAAEGPPMPPPLPGSGFRLLWAGGYNTWMDVETLFHGVETAIARNPDIAFVSTGGPIAGHHEGGHAAFWSLVRASPFAARFSDRGRLPRKGALAVLAESHAVVSVSRACLEAEVGSRQRVVEALAWGRPVVATGLGDLAAVVAEAEAGIVVAPGDADALAAAVLALAGDAGRRDACAARARRLWEARFTVRATTAALRAWVHDPRPWPRSILDDGGRGQLLADRLRLQGELDAIRGSLTFRALRVFDRLLGRGGSSRASRS